MDVVTLVPWRAGDWQRDLHWEFVEPRLRELGFPLYLGDSEGPWARAAACNAASKAAGDWEIALIADADTVLEPDAVYRTIEKVWANRAAARPHNHRWMLNRRTSKIFKRDGPSALREPLPPDALGGGAVVIHREAWETVGGYDERFVGWGYEDSAFGIALATTVGWERIPGNAYHLNHMLPNTRSAAAMANRALLDIYREEHARAIEEVSVTAGYDLNTVL